MIISLSIIGVLIHVFPGVVTAISSHILGVPPTFHGLALSRVSTTMVEKFHASFLLAEFGCSHRLPLQLRSILLVELSERIKLQLVIIDEGEFVLLDGFQGLLEGPVGRREDWVHRDAEGAL